MAKFLVPNDVKIHSTRAFLSKNNFFDITDGRAVLEFHPYWVHLEPMGLVMIAAWSAWCRRMGLKIEIENLTKRADYAARMKLFEIMGVEYAPKIREHEESGRFLPLRNITKISDVRSVIADVSALLHLDADKEALAAVQYCLSELLRNVFEHSNSPDGAYVCAQRYSGRGPHRVTLAVADCGIGITKHLKDVYPQVEGDDLLGLRFALTPGITGSRGGIYGTPDNAGAGLFITRSISKGTGGYFEIVSGNATYRLRRTSQQPQMQLFPDPFMESSDKWRFDHGWQGTVVTLEISTDRISEFGGFFKWIRDTIPAPVSVQNRIRFT